MNVLWALLCDTVIIDEQTNRVSIIGVIDEINVPAPPPERPSETGEHFVTAANMRLMALWARSDPGVPESSQARVRIVAPNGDEWHSEEHMVDLSDATLSRTIAHITGLPPLARDGMHLFRLESQMPDSTWSEEFELPLRVHVQFDDS